MKKALINPNQNAYHIVSWTLDNNKNYIPVSEMYENGFYVCEVCDSEFPVCEPIYWVDCDDNIIAYEYYLDTTDNLIKIIENAPKPQLEQPVSEGTQTL
jgi:hypothetical protein